LAVVAAALAGCERHPVDIEAPERGRQLTREEEADLQRVADGAFRDAKAVLEGLPPRLTLIVRFGSDVIPETGETGAAAYPGNVALTLDANRDVRATIRTFVRPCLLHELHHLSRQSRVPIRLRVLDRVVSEGLATAFERDASPSKPPWGEPDREIETWTQDVLRDADSPDVGAWFDHAKGYRGHRVGVHLVDRAMRATKKSAAELTFVPADEIVKLADVAR
jgi:uncharacterized protein YjaZ